MSEIPKGTICSNCKKHPATIWWVGDASQMDVNHGARQEPWCGVCEVRAQLQWCKEQAKRIPGLEKKLKKLLSQR
jgi:hypothetical protein